MRASCGPPKISVQAMFFGTGANGRVMRASLRHASARFGNVPPTGLQRNVYVRLPGSPWPAGQTVTFSDVEAATIARNMVIVPG